MDCRSLDCRENIGEFMVRIEFDKLDGRVGGGELAGEFDGDDIVVQSMENKRGLVKVRKSRILEGVFDEAVMDWPGGLLNIMKDVDGGSLGAIGGIRPALLPARGEIKSRGEQYNPYNFGVSGGIKGREVAAHAGADQADGGTREGPFDEGELAGNGEM